MRVPLDPTSWSNELIGGRVVRVGKTWLDMAAAVPVTLRAWLIDEGSARRWPCAHGDALDAWVLSRGVGWIGMRVDLEVAWAAEAWLGTHVSLPADLCDAARHDRVLPWWRAAVVLRRAGVVPAAPPALHLLASRPVGWWGTVAVAGGSGDLDRLACMAVARFAAGGGKVHRLHPGEAGWEVEPAGETHHARDRTARCAGPSGAGERRPRGTHGALRLRDAPSGRRQCGRLPVGRPGGHPAG